MKYPDLFDLVAHCEAEISLSDVRQMERERLRTSLEKSALIAEIVALIFAGVK